MNFGARYDNQAGFIKAAPSRIVIPSTYTKMPFPHLLLSLLLINVPSLSAAVPFRNATVNLGYAQYQGFTDASSNNTNFLSIRYAAPPTGSSSRFEYTPQMMKSQ